VLPASLFDGFRRLPIQELVGLGVGAPFVACFVGSPRGGAVTYGLEPALHVGKVVE
jgi:hypothetical protein